MISGMPCDRHSASRIFARASRSVVLAVLSRYWIMRAPPAMVASTASAREEQSFGVSAYNPCGWKAMDLMNFVGQARGGVPMNT